MSSAQSALNTEAEVLFQLCFWTPLLFVVIYTWRTRWIRTVHGRTLAALALVFVIVLLRGELTYLGVIQRIRPGTTDVLQWITVSALVLAPAAFLTMTWQLVRKPLHRWITGLRKSSDDPLGEGAPSSLSDYKDRGRKRRHHAEGQGPKAL